MGDGASDKAKGNVKEAAGDLTGDKDLEREGKVDQTSGSIKDKVGDAADSVKDALKRDWNAGRRAVRDPAPPGRRRDGTLTRMALIQALDFIGIPSQDADRARSFYRDVIMECAPTSTRTTSSGRATRASASGSPSGRGWTSSPRPVTRSRCAWRTLRAARTELEGKGVTFFGDTLDTGVCQMAFFADPDGNQLERLHRRYAPYPDA